MDKVYINTKDLPRWLVRIYFEDKDLITIDDLIEKLEDTTDELDLLKEKFDEFKEEVEENYKYSPQT